MIERPILSLAILIIASSVSAQTQSTLVARMLFPPRNYEIALGDTITPSVRVWNRDTVPHSGDAIRYNIKNVVTGIALYSRLITLPLIAAGDSLDTTFVPYYTNKSILSQLGTFDGCLILGSDTICSRLFGVRRTSVPFIDPSNNYSKTKSGDIPDQTLWISVGTTVVDGEDSTWNPPPPRDASGYGPDGLVSPVIRLDRKDINGNFYLGSGIRDTLTSFPINLQGKTHVTIGFDYMRGGRYHYPLGWDSSQMFGPESTILDSAGNVVRAGDSLLFEFKKPSAPAVNPSPADWNEMAALDGGRDFEFKSVLAHLTDSGWQITIGGKSSFVHDTSNYFTTDFRFRLRLKAKNDAPQNETPRDDGDPWYIDNPTVTIPLRPEIEMLWVRAVNPYTKVPASQASFPIYVDVVNIGSDGSDIPIQVNITDPSGDTVYSQIIQLAQLTYFGQGQDTILQFPNWDASGEAGITGPFTVIASMAYPDYDDYYEGPPYTKFYLNIETGPGSIQEFALDDAGLDPGPDTGNDIPKLTGLRDEGIGFNSTTTGSFAMKFQLVRPDTFYGARLYFTIEAANGVDYCRISLLNGDPNSCTPLNTVVQAGRQSTILAATGLGSDQFSLSPYYFPMPIPLQPGTYWISVSQLGLDNFFLGGNISRGGGEIVCAHKTAPKISAIYGPLTPGAPWYGTQWGSGPGDNNGNVSCSFAVETPAGSGNWKPMMPDSGLWPTMDTSYPLIWHFSPNLDTLPWGGAGTYFPLMRPMFAGHPLSGIKSSPVVSSFGLEPIYPNPFDPTAAATTITFTLPAQVPVSLTICNIMGDVIKTLMNASMPAGMHSVSWDGRDEHGAIVPAGVYLVSLRSASGVATAKLILAE